MTRIRGRYEPLEVVGRGGQGQVMRALDHQHGRPVALKIRRLAAPADRETLLREARVLLAVEPHPGIALLRDDFFDDDRYCMVMDWIEGTTLAHVLRDRSRLPLEEAVLYLEQVAQAIDHLHRSGVVHLDVKPANVVLTPAKRAVLVDFGIAQRRGSEEGGAYGTTGYQAPELAAMGEATAAADVFGLAATAFALLTGAAPGAGERERWERFAAGCPERVTAALRRALAGDPTRRPRSAAELVAALRGEPQAPGNLPQPLTSFVGRAPELEEVRTLLQTTRLVTLTGSGGIGKTRLALRAASELQDTFPDGAWLVELSAVEDPRLVAGAVSAGLGVREEPGRSLDETLASHLMTRHLLLVLDNCEHLVEPCAYLADSLLRGAGRLHVLATSREPLGVPGEAVLRVPPLPVPDSGISADVEALGGLDSVRLFCERARLVSRGFVLSAANGGQVAEICRRLDGVPLAIELAAAGAATVPVDELAGRLDDRLAILTRGPRTADPRQQTLRAAIDWSHDLLSREEKTVFRRLAVFAGSLSLQAAEAICAGDGLESAAVLECISRLVDRSLLEPEEHADEARYRLLQVVREYAAERLEDAGESTPLRLRHRDWFLSYAEAADADCWEGRKPAAALGRLERERDNLRAALDWTLAHAEGGWALRLATALWMFWETRGHFREGRESLVAAANCDPRARPRLRGLALTQAGLLARLQGDLEAADALLKESLAIREAIEDDAGIASTKNAMGVVTHDLGEHARARNLLSEALAIRRRIGDRWGVADALQNLGAAAVEQGDLDTARVRLEEAVEIAREVGSFQDVAWSLHGLGSLAARRGDLVKARALCEEGLETSRSHGDRPTTARSLLALGSLELQLGNPESALRAYEESLTFSRDLEDRRGIALGLHELGVHALWVGEHERALSMLRESIEVDRELGHDRGVAESLSQLGVVHAALSDLELAQSVQRDALAAFSELRYPDGVYRCRERLGRLALARGAAGKAAGLLREALKGFDEMDEIRGVASCLGALGEAARAEGRFERAARLLGAASALWESMGYVPAPSESGRHRSAVGAARAALGEVSFGAAWEAGREMGAGEAAAYAGSADR